MKENPSKGRTQRSVLKIKEVEVCSYESTGISLGFLESSSLYSGGPSLSPLHKVHFQ